MSLDWDISKCADTAALKTEAQWNVTQVVIFECMAVGLGTITAKNLDEFKMRSDFYRKLDGLALIPRDELAKYVGLRTNVTTETWAKFVKRHADGYKRDCEYRARREASQTA